MNQFEFQSMDEIRAKVEEYKKTMPYEIYQSFAFLLGVLPNQGVSVDVDINGEIIAIDKSIAPFIQKLVASGVQTLACCSGISSEHPDGPFAPSTGYLSLVYQKQLFEALTDILNDERISISKGKCYLKDSINIQLKAADNELFELWPKVCTAVLQTSAKLK